MQESWISCIAKLQFRCLLANQGQNTILGKRHTLVPATLLSVPTRILAIHMFNHISRRNFLASTTAGLGAALAIPKNSLFAQTEKAKPFKISLAQWSLHKSLQQKKLDNLDFAKVAKEKFGIEAVEYVNQFFKDKANDATYLAEMKKRTSDLGVTNVLIMVDGEGALGDVDEQKRNKAVENHYKWVDAAKYLGCHSIRVNAETKADYEEGKKFAADGLRRLSEYAKPLNMNVIVENHGGLSSNGKWLSETIRMTGLANCGTLPDFGNFYEYDRYQGVTDLMPLAKAVSAKSYDFDTDGNETKIDFMKMMKIVMDANYHSWVGIEYEGSKMSEDDGIMATKKLLEKCLAAMV
jgi:L-ribulose-5-phosphate 3-epimerase